MKSAQEYNASSIKHLENIDHVRKRPETYIGDRNSAGLHHLVKEVIDNSIDEALAGFCTEIDVIIHENGAIEISDNGRGIPTEVHPDAGIPTPELIVTKLGAGGKFDASTYKVSGGLNGMGITLVNALSSWFQLEIHRNSKIFSITFEKGIKSIDYANIGKTTKTGTIVRFIPDKSIFSENTFSLDILSQRLMESAYLIGGLKFSIEDKRINKFCSYRYPNGILEFINNKNSSKATLHSPIRISGKDGDIQVDLVLQYTDSFSEDCESFANNINTPMGGTHLSGFKSALTRCLNNFGKRVGIFTANPPSGEELREGLVAIITVLVPQPQFESQTKVKLMSPKVQTVVERLVYDFMATYAEENPSVIKLICEKAELARQAHDAARKARDLARRKTTLTGGGGLPDKLADCAIRDPSQTEIFIVEGDSAGGSARQARNKATQAILPIRGKILNVEKSNEERIFKHSEIEEIIRSLGAGFDIKNKGGFTIDKLRYNKIIIMTDADVDGSHIRTLLLTFFFRQMPSLIENGHIYAAQPPLFMISSGSGKNKIKKYTSSDTKLAGYLAENKDTTNVVVKRFKGLGEMNASELWETTMDPTSRTLLRITMGDAVEANRIFDLLMGDSVEPRRKFIEDHSKLVKYIDI